MEDALRIIMIKSPRAASFALQTLRAIQASSPLVQIRYNQTVSMALADSEATFTEEDRACLIAHIDEDEPTGRDFTLRVRLTEPERIELLRLADEARQTMSDYVRDRLFRPA